MIKLVVQTFCYPKSLYRQAIINFLCLLLYIYIYMYIYIYYTYIYIYISIYIRRRYDVWDFCLVIVGNANKGGRHRRKLSRPSDSTEQNWPEKWSCFTIILKYRLDWQCKGMHTLVWFTRLSTSKVIHSEAARYHTSKRHAWRQKATVELHMFITRIRVRLPNMRLGLCACLCGVCWRVNA